MQYLDNVFFLGDDKFLCFFPLYYVVFKLTFVNTQNQYYL